MLVNNIPISEAQVREALVAQLTETAPVGAVLRQEAVVLSTRIDVLRVGELLEGFEIKSDFDTVTRLPRQAEVYSQVLDEVTLVTGAELEADAVHLVPRWWGVVRATVRRDGSGRVCLKTLRPARRNPAQLPTALASMLWRNEAADALQSVAGLPAPKSWTADRLRQRLAGAVPCDVLRRLVSNRLLDEARLERWHEEAIARARPKKMVCCP